ncbi:hypothetical protein HAX54_009597 [Datura stramonium]|uniref:Uncharacterized protein n=1 Tax=Datura stramonium TaxID=4076 RepID=A0ABS8WXI8_DATST|nr:hypothetical protein [Datura stramonium]
MGVDVCEFPVKEITSTYNDRAFANGSSNSALSSLLTELKDVKETLGAVSSDLHKSNELLDVLISNVVDLKNQLTLIQHEGVKSFNKVLCQVDSPAARAEISDNEAVQNS